MEDDNLILNFSGDLEVFKIKKIFIEKIKIKNNEFHCSRANKLSNNKIFGDGYDDFRIYLYEKNEIKQDKKLWITFDSFKNFKIINENEIAFCHTIINKFFWNSEFITFYDIKYKTEQKLKLGNYDFFHVYNILLINHYLVMVCNDKILLIDINKKTIINNLKYDKKISSMISLNEKTFLINNSKDNILYLFEIKSNEIKLKEEKEDNYYGIIKYPGNILISNKDNKSIVIYGQK